MSNLGLEYLSAFKRKLELEQKEREAETQLALLKLRWRMVFIFIGAVLLMCVVRVVHYASIILH